MKGRDEKLLLHMSVNGIQAGKNFDLFQRLMAEAIKLVPSEVRFTCPDTEKITVERDQLRAICDELAGAVRSCNCTSHDPLFCARCKALARYRSIADKGGAGD